MSKFLKIMAKVMPVLMVVVLIGSSVLGVTPGLPSLGGEANSDVQNLAGNVWQTVMLVIQILAVAAIILAGVRYMFASPDSKADIKQQTIYIIFGAVLVFAAGPITTLISKIANGIIE